MHIARIGLSTLVLGALALAPMLVSRVAHADRASHELPPWTDPNDLPLSPSMRSLVTQRAEVPIFSVPGKLDTRRGTMMPNARLPVYGAKRAPNCNARWLLVGPLAWVCADVVDPSPEPAWSIKERGQWASLPGSDGLPFRYYFVGQNGAFGYEEPGQSEEASPAQEYESGFIVAGAEERHVRGERWLRTPRRRWLSLRELAPTSPSSFHGEKIEGEARAMDVAWVVSDNAKVRRGPRSSDAAVGARPRLARVVWKEERAVVGGAMVRISEDGATPEEWMLARDLAHPTVSERPQEVAADERWIDVDLASQTLTAYVGNRPVYTTLVSTGRGTPGSDTATPKGSHRVWVKLATTNMNNLEREDADRRYSIEDVPYVQFFDRGVALHGAFWHKDFGRVHSHGCVNLAPLDAEWFFNWTLPHLPAGWSAVFPTALEPGTLVRVR
ncbi:L,D-transpeptidase [Pendulispora albinea]|uniref:L,D-transpeptidase n=1 Tax=Pendulispora albinea TaxID=2741071 RepID=A0ABZ2M268_9BACT